MNNWKIFTTLTIFFVLTHPFLKWIKLWPMQKIKYKNDNFEKHMKKTWIVQKIVKNMRNLLWCCRAPVASDRVEETWPSVANCRAWSSWSDDIQTLLTQKQIKNLPDIHHEEDQITLTTFPAVAFTYTSLSWRRTNRLFSSSITPFTCIKFIDMERISRGCKRKND